MVESHLSPAAGVGPAFQGVGHAGKKQQQRLVAITKHYPSLSPIQKQRLYSRLESWSKLTPEQRNRARKKFQEIDKIPSEKKEQAKRAVLQQEAGGLIAPTADQVGGGVTSYTD